jgi:glycosyltransferase 2 family protein
MLCPSLAALVPAPLDRRRALLGFVGAIPAKYLPGAVGQPLGVVGLSAQDRSQVAPASVAFVYSSILSLGVGVGVGSLALHGWMRLSALAGATGIGVALTRPLPRWLFRRIGLQHAKSKPSPRQLGIATAWNVAGFTGFGVSAWLLLDGSTPETLALVVSAFSLAWSTGFAAVVLPAGAGVREAILVWSLTTAYPAGALLAMAIQHRLVTLVADLILVAIWRPWRKLLARSTLNGMARLGIEWVTSVSSPPTRIQVARCATAGIWPYPAGALAG